MNNCAWFLFATASFFLAVSGGNINSVAGPYRMLPDHFERCPKEIDAEVPVTLYYYGFRDRNNIDLWYYTGNFTTSFEWNDNLMLDIRVASWSARGGWKDNAHIFKVRKACEAQRKFTPELNRSLMMAMYGDPDRKCPFPAGTYVFKNVSTDFSVVPAPIFFYGKWRSDVRLVDPETQEVKGCLRMFLETVPKL